MKTYEISFGATMDIEAKTKEDARKKVIEMLENGEIDFNRLFDVEEIDDL